MTPAAELIYNHDYAQRLYQGEKPFSEAWQDLVYQGEVFERAYHEIIVPALETLPKITGFEWARRELPIYVIPEGQSMAAPLTLVASADVEDMLFTLITLLTRVNVATGFTTDLKRDQVMHAVARAVATALKIDLEDAAAEAMLRLHEKYGEDFQPLGWDLTTRTARAYLSPNT